MVMPIATATAMEIKKMNEINTVFLKILNCALSGAKAPDLPDLSEEQWMSLVKLATEHKVLPMVYDVIYAYVPLPHLRGNVRHQVMTQTLKTDAFLRLYRSWQEAGVQPIVVKGLICRNLYPKPDHRPSSDEDVLVHPDQLSLATDVLEQNGLTTTEKDPQAYEFPYKSSEAPVYIELHQSLFPPQSDSYGHWNHLFSHVFETAYFEEYFGVPVRTLPPTDHLFYMICHALKHFVHSGFGIRQVCDMIVYANHWGADIDWDVLMDKCESVRATSFAAAIFAIGQQYLCFDMERSHYTQAWRDIDVDSHDLLEDLLSSGIYGTASATRLHSSNMTLDAVSGDRGEGSGSSVLRAVFPAAKKISGQYPYLKKHPWLLPAAWTHRIFKYRKELKSGGTGDAMESVRIGNQRIQLLRQYGVIK